MNIRKATPEDKPEIIAVLKDSLGESKLKKTEAIWNYKHIENPFGPSLVLIAVENDQIIGVRAFMRWKWQIKEKLYSAFRAVDTATHPAHRGKGVFKKLTLKALEIGTEEGVHFVFNTPNEQSKPGYLKMGWNEVSKLNIQLTPVNPFKWKKASSVNYSHSINASEDLSVLCDYRHNEQVQLGQLFTPKTENFLEWRYSKNPLQDYHIIKEKDFYVAAYVKIHKHFKELRVVECFSKSPSATQRAKKQIKNSAGQFGVQIISAHQNNMRKMGLSSKLGPVLTLRNMNLSKNENSDYQDLKNWNYTLGDLELF